VRPTDFKNLKPQIGHFQERLKINTIQVFRRLKALLAQRTITDNNPLKQVMLAKLLADFLENQSTKALHSSKEKMPICIAFGTRFLNLSPCPNYILLFGGFLGALGVSLGVR